MNNSILIVKRVIFFRKKKQIIYCFYYVKYTPQAFPNLLETCVYLLYESHINSCKSLATIMVLGHPNYVIFLYDTFCFFFLVSVVKGGKGIRGDFWLINNISNVYFRVFSPLMFYQITFRTISWLNSVNVLWDRN